jgi:exo-beta-1,3-glucanase (GH17 family)
VADIKYLINVRNSEEIQTISISGEVVNSGVILESDMDSAVQAFASDLAAGGSGPALTLDSVHKVTNSTTDVVL